MNGEIAQKPAFGVGEDVRNAMKAWQGNHGVAQTAEAVNQNLPNRRLRLQFCSPERNVCLFCAAQKHETMASPADPIGTSGIGAYGDLLFLFQSILSTIRMRALPDPNCRSPINQFIRSTGPWPEFVGDNMKSRHHSNGAPKDFAPGQRHAAVSDRNQGGGTGLPDVSVRCARPENGPCEDRAPPFPYYQISRLRHTIHD